MEIVKSVDRKRKVCYIFGMEKYGTQFVRCRGTRTFKSGDAPAAAGRK